MNNYKVSLGAIFMLVITLILTIIMGFLSDEHKTGRNVLVGLNAVLIFVCIIMQSIVANNLPSEGFQANKNK